MENRRIFPSNEHAPTGFTLIELTIVLIIIGLVMAMIVKGRDIIKSARTKKDYVNYVERLYDDVFKYKAFVFERNGYEGIIGDGEENGGYEPEANGYIDTDTDNKTAAILVLGTSDNFTEVALLKDYDGTKRPYDPSDDSHIIAYLQAEEVDPEITNAFRFRNGNEGFMFTTSGGAIKKTVHAYLGSDAIGEARDNFLVFEDISSDEARAFDTMIDDVANGITGNFIVLGYKLASSCYTNRTSSTCKCFDSQRTCIGKGAEGGCPYPSCPPEEVEKLVCGYRLRE